MLISCVAMGGCLSLAVFLQPVSQDTGWSRTGVSSAGNHRVPGDGRVGLRLGLAERPLGHAAGRAVGRGAAGHRPGRSPAARRPCSSSSCCSACWSAWPAAAFYAPLMTVASAWFDRQRSLAVSLVSAGMGMAPLIVAPFVRWLITGLRLAHRHADVRHRRLRPAGAGGAADPRPPPAIRRRACRDHPPRAATQPPMTAAQAFRSPQFVALALTFFACCAAHSGPIFHMVSYAIVCGIAPMAAVSDLQRRGPRGSAAACCSASRRQVRRQAGAGRRACCVQALAIAHLSS